MKCDELIQLIINSKSCLKVIYVIVIFTALSIIIIIIYKFCEGFVLYLQLDVVKSCLSCVMLAVMPAIK